MLENRRKEEWKERSRSMIQTRKMFNVTVSSSFMTLPLKLRALADGMPDVFIARVTQCRSKGTRNSYPSIGSNVILIESGGFFHPIKPPYSPP